MGGGPGGLYLAALAKQLDPASQVVVFERNAFDDTFGFGVVFSDETLEGFEQADPVLFAAVSAQFARWSDIDVVHRGETVTSGGHGFSAINRRVLLELLARRCTDVGVDVRFRTVAPPVETLRAEYDLVVAADGARSSIRTSHASVFGPDLDVRGARYMWLGLDRALDAFTFVARQTAQGALMVHAYPFSETRSTFIVEAGESTWRALGFDAVDAESLPPGVSDEASIAALADLFRDELGGAELVANNSKWLRFTTVRNRRWHDGNLVLLGDAAHTAHFSIGSGTKLAMEDALALAASLRRHTEVPTALAAYESERRPVVESTQRAAQASLEWFSDVDHVTGLDPQQFAFNLLTRSRRVTFDNLAVRDPGYAAEVRTHFAPGAPPLFQPFTLGNLLLHNRIIAAPVTVDAACDGVPGDAEMLMLSAAAVGGAALVLTGGTAVSPDARACESSSGLWDDAHVAAWRVITDRIHATSGARVGVQLTHAGRRGVAPVAPTPVPYREGDPAPGPVDEDAVVAAFADAARRAADAGFDALELHAGHGHLLSTYLSPLTHPGDLADRLRFPLRVLDAVRAVWSGPLLVRISAVDHAPGGQTIEDAVEVARALAAHGAGAVDVSSGEVVAHQRPNYGRSYQTPLAERIRHDAGVPVVAVGGISTADDANSIVLAGRADLVAVGRAVLHDPAWALHAAVALGWDDVEWPVHLRAGAAPPPTARRVPPRLTLTDPEPLPVHRRWRPLLTSAKG
ncbi:anthraniloyl-CoA monooxygenase [Pseudonocardia sp. N23]|nr:anthraniloyl-CoA monooxygenase [Pseudonocardia sp. N23]